MLNYGLIAASGGNAALPRGRSHLAAILGALLFVSAPCAASEHGGFSVLKLGGYPVRWLPKVPNGKIALRYKVAAASLEQPNAINCKGIRPPETVLKTSNIRASEFRRALSIAFQQWRDTADLAFIEVADHETADVVIGEQTSPIGFAFTNLELARTPTNGVRPIVSASICLNPQRFWKVGYDGNLSVYDLVHTFAHEIGHVIGLDHPVGRAHLMSFRYSETLDGLSDGDKRGAIAIYGPSRLRSEVITLGIGVEGKGPRATTTIGRSISSSAAD